MPLVPFGGAGSFVFQATKMRGKYLAQGHAAERVTVGLVCGAPGSQGHFQSLLGLAA